MMISNLKTLWSPCFIRKYFSTVRVNAEPALPMFWFNKGHSIARYVSKDHFSFSLNLSHDNAVYRVALCVNSITKISYIDSIFIAWLTILVDCEFLNRFRHPPVLWWIFIRFIANIYYICNERVCQVIFIHLKSRWRDTTPSVWRFRSDNG